MKFSSTVAKAKKIPLRDFQKSWHKRRIRAGGHCFLAIFVKNDGLVRLLDCEVLVSYKKTLRELSMLSVCDPTDIGSIPHALATEFTHIEYEPMKAAQS